MKHILRGLSLVALVALAQAQVDVVESQPDTAGSESVYPAPRSQTAGGGSLYPQARDSSQVATRPSAAANAGAASGELFFQLQALQEELMQLRGLVEEHEQSIRQLKQQRLDDYMNLDRRLAEIGTTAPSAASGTGVTPGPGPVGPAAGDIATTPGPVVATLPTVGEDESYRSAYGLVKARRFPEATEAFENFLVQHPDGSMAPNAYYWLGELYMLDGRNAAARQRFETLLGRYPDNRKSPDAMFKLAKVYHLEGRDADARRLLEQLTSGHAGTSAARLASEYLQQNF